MCAGLHWLAQGDGLMIGRGEVGKKNKFLVAGVLLLLVIVAVLGYLNYRAVSAARSSSLYSAGQILIHGLQDQDFDITLGDLKKLPAVTRYAEATQSNGEEIRVEATGPLLDTLLKEYGKSQQDFSRIRFTARDNYSIAVPSDILKNRQIILSYINDGKPLEDDWQPIRVVIPGEMAMYWVKDMIRIDFETGSDKLPAKKLVFLDAAEQNLTAEWITGMAAAPARPSKSRISLTTTATAALCRMSSSKPAMALRRTRPALTL